MQISIAAGEDLPTGEKSSRLEISWRLNFLHSTMMKGMIESGARQGIKDSYEIYREVTEKAHCAPALAPLYLIEKWHILPDKHVSSFVLL